MTLGLRQNERLALRAPVRSAVAAHPRLRDPMSQLKGTRRRQGQLSASIIRRLQCEEIASILMRRRYQFPATGSQKQ